MHAYILVEHQVARATRGRNALEICNFESFIAKQTSTSTDAEVAVASTGLTDSTSGVGVEANITHQLALSVLQEEGSRTSGTCSIQHTCPIVSINSISRRTPIEVAGEVKEIRVGSADEGTGTDEVTKSSQRTRLN